MARIKMRIPFLVRELVGQIETVLGRQLGVPMNCDIPLPSGKECREGTARIAFSLGTRFVCAVEVGLSGMQWLRLFSLRGQMWFGRKEWAQEWVQEVEPLSGPFEWSWDEDRSLLRFRLEPLQVTRLEVCACNARNGLPTYRWDDPEHPAHNF